MKRMLDKYEDRDFGVHLKIKDDEAYLSVEPYTEEITREDVIELFKHVLKQKPRQFPIGMFKKVLCEDCHDDFVIYKKQVFCPACYSLELNLYDGDVNDDYPKIFEEWQKRKNCIENIVNGNVIEFIDDFNDNIAQYIEKTEIDFFDDEVLVDE